ncbi:MAG: hypothetical protein JNL68_15825 [Burkholderiales bacterium]|nr:hypothetical protein [Burkholderiales bacterium]
MAHVLPRQRLFAALEEMGGGTVAFVSAPAGSGKTTLAASYVAQKHVPSIWFRVDAADQDLATFFASLSQASRIVSPRKCGRLPTFTPEHALGLAAFSRRFFRELYQALGAPAIIVFDGLHEVAPDSPLLHVVLREACGEIAGGTHLILVSRDMVPSSLARLQANRALRLIDWNSLRLTVEEAQAIALRYDLPPARQQEIPRLIESVDGWAAGLILALEGARADRVASRFAIAGSRPIFNYFAAEVFEGLTEERQDVLMRLAVLPDISAPAARALAGSDSAEQVLEELSRRNAFTQRIGEERPVFQLHPLFREFLVDRANGRLGKGELAELRTKAALLLESEGRIDEAVVLWKGMEDWGSIIRILRQHAHALLQQGRLKTLERWLRCLPQEIVHEDGWLSLWLGTCIVFFNPVEARRHFERAYSVCTSHGDLVGRLCAWCGLADAIFLLYQNLSELDPLIEEFDRELFDIVDSTPQEIQARVTASVFTVLSFRRMGHPRMTLWADRARGLLANPQAGAPVSQVHAFLAQYHIWRGDLTTAQDLVESLSQNRQDPFPSPQTVTLSYLVEATYALHAGLHDACIASASAGLEAARQSGVHLWDTIFLGHCVAVRLSTGDLRQADALLAQLAGVLEQFPNGDEAYFRALTFWRHYVAKDIPKAMHVAEIADRCRRALNFDHPCALNFDQGWIAACH